MILGCSYYYYLLLPSQATITDISCNMALVTQVQPSARHALLRGSITIQGGGRLMRGPHLPLLQICTGTLLYPGKTDRQLNQLYECKSSANSIYCGWWSIFDAQAGATMPVFGIIRI